MKLTVGQLKEIIKNISNDIEVTIEIGGDSSSYGQLITARKVELNKDGWRLLISDNDDEEVRNEQ